MREWSGLSIPTLYRGHAGKGCSRPACAAAKGRAGIEKLRSRRSGTALAQRGSKGAGDGVAGRGEGLRAVLLRLLPCPPPALADLDLLNRLCI